ncbi:MAG TPA: cob(I)yrinic acid a,c-diamide adenosyltransferase [Candidatus Methanoperedens sp.]|nr:cob(I)yrinic acid a,c-diamide adenosyltransferase [Candidatus Methanoperedens sp.]
MKRAQLHLYYGGGKGKSTAAFGQAVRAWGQGWRVLLAQFLKDARHPSSEIAAAAALGPRFRLLRAKLPAPAIGDPGPEGRRRLRAASRELLAQVSADLGRRRYDVVVLDEVLVACHYRLLAVADVRRAVRLAGERGARLVVLTGRWVPPALLRDADLATELSKIRHPFDTGAKPVHGIDY